MLINLYDDDPHHKIILYFQLNRNENVVCYQFQIILFLPTLLPTICSQFWNFEITTTVFGHTKRTESMGGDEIRTLDTGGEWLAHWKNCYGHWTQALECRVGEWLTLWKNCYGHWTQALECRVGEWLTLWKKFLWPLDTGSRV